MGLRIQNNVEAFNAHRNLTGTASKAAKAMEKLSSGYRVNRAADDAAGLAISEKMRGQISGLAQAQRNAQDGVSLVQTAEGALQTVSSMVQRIRDLKVQYNNETLNTADRTALDSEYTALKNEILTIRTGTEFNGIDLLSSVGNVKLQVGANHDEFISAATVDLATSIGVINTAGSLGDAAVTLTALDTAIANVASARSGFGAVQNRLEHRLNNLSIYQENLVASESRIRDVDMAAEMVNFSKLQILQQAGTSMLAQANQSSQSVLSLLR
ncbi:MAG: Flagellin protein FlaA [uncultured Solirubrobacteraceae bacterium]|uniref:Flagellin n=1 Tax=uncultured Solirubrobacteraceae bacterium TaxID=1162706 RepID=A0A6J4RNL1_9ACTN|nr:MAG: Flagellin protein FlaA [uncultured Solirubrobacteraceae bacterium]